jgi:hypothetical protein
MNKSDEINELATALAKAQSEIENASKGSSNPHFKSKYADLAEVLNTVRPVLAAHGLSVAQFPSYADGVVSVETVLMHGSGQWLSGIISAPVSKMDAQGVGSATTYCRRYSLAAVAGIAQEDDDANSAVGHSPKQAAKPAAKVATVTPDQVKQLREAIQAAGKTEPAWCAEVRIESLEGLAADRFKGAMGYLAQSKEKAA